MWSKIPDLIIRYRLYFMLVIIAITVFMGYHASKVELAYDFARTVPPNDPDMIFLTKFKSQFGEDGNVLAVGMRDSAIYQLENFDALRELNNELKQIGGIKDVLSLPMMKIIGKDTVNQRFFLHSLFPDAIESQQQLDSLLSLARDQQFYEGKLYNQKGAVAMLVSIDKDYANSAKRVGMTDSLVMAGKRFEAKTKIQLRYAGLPFVRTVVAEKVRKELSFFLELSALVTGIIMLLFFRSFRAVIFSMIMIGILVVWTLGTVSLFGYKISMLIGLIPPVIVTIGITNAIYLLNKYHSEFIKTGNKMDAIRVVVRKMGLATFLTNLTVAIGFLTLLYTDIMVMREFGIVAGINIIALFFVSLIMIPGMLSWMPEPNAKHLKHLDFKLMGTFVRGVDKLVQFNRSAIYIATALVTVFSIVGMWKLDTLSYMVDDIPEKDQVKKDLKFFEENFTGVMPLEIVVDMQTKRKRPLLDVKNIQLVDEFEQSLDSITVTSRPVSIVSFVKAAKMAYYNNNPERYTLPSKTESGFILRYMKGQKDNSGLFNSFVDSTFSKMRISMQMADIGSKKMDSLIQQVIQPKADKLALDLKNNLKSKSDSVAVTITGSSKIFIKGNKFLIDNLTESLILACILITLSMAMLFANIRMIIISLIPNLLALMITAGLMGYFNIALKPSTAIIFSITFGISVDNSIRFLAKYRQELFSATGAFFVPRCVSESILETGKSIIYTSVVLFAGFIIFAFSDFGGTISLGILTSVTLVISMFTNLILLPALILTFDKPKPKKEHQLIDELDPTFYGEEEDEAIDLSKIKIHDRAGAAE